MKDAALAGALEMVSLGFSVFPLKSGTKDGFLAKSWKAQATADAAEVRKLAARFPGCNWGMRCTGHLVLDVDVADGKAGEASLLMLDLEHGLPVTRAHRSARGGRHVLMRLPAGVEVTNRDTPLGEGINVRGAGGYIIAPGSTFGGLPYTVETAAPIAEAPASLVTLLRAPDKAVGKEASPEHMDHPADVAGALDWLQRRPVAVKGERGASVYKAAARLRDWGLTEETALELIGEHYAPNMDPPADTPFCRHEVASAYRYAQNSAGARSVAVDFEDVSALAEELAPPADAPPIAKGAALRWPVTDEDGKPIAKAHDNIRAFLHHVGAELWRDDFALQGCIRGFDTFDGPLDDDALRALHVKAFALGLATPKEHFMDFVIETARQQAKHPVREYLDGLKWDGVPRVGSWLSRYLGAEESPLVAEFGRLWLTAAVRRVRQPGCKFDTMLVLEGAQGAGKSTALKILAGQWFEESVRLSAEPKEMIEQTRGKWVIEVPELSGMAAREVEHVKALITRTEDTARLAYARSAVTVPRQFVLAATTNDDKYLRDTTGNRRFWPVKVGEVDLDGLAADRDQVWAEAAAIEARGEPLTLHPSLWAAAGEVQAAREASNTVREVLEPVYAGGLGYTLVSDTWAHFGWSQSQGRLPSTGDSKMVADEMRRLGWIKKRRRVGAGNPVYVFENWPSSATTPPPRFSPNSGGLALVGGVGDCGT